MIKSCNNSLWVRLLSVVTSTILFQLSNCEYLDILDANREELCIQETFKASCSQGDVVFVSEARYGRMSIGKCLSEKELESFGPFNKDPRYVGCFDEVSQMLNDKCSFKSNCEIKVSDLQADTRLLESTACFPGLIKYLEVQYSCLSVLGSNGIENCKITLPRQITHLNPNHVSNHCKSLGNGLLVEAPKGQRIKFTIFHHNKLIDKSENWPAGRASCGSLMADIKDNVGKTNATVCQNGFLVTDSKNPVQNFKQVFQTKSHLVEIMLLPNEETGNNYLLRLEVEGCLDIIPPEDTWLKRTNDDIVIGCYSSKQTWYLRCESGKWSGNIGNCSQYSQKLGSTLNEEEGDGATISGKITMSENSQILIIIAICGFGLVVCLVIVCFGMICLNRFKKKDIPIADDKMPGSMQYSTYCANPNFNGTVRPFNPSNLNHLPQLDESADQERYQVLDRDEVAKESSLLADY